MKEYPIRYLPQGSFTLDSLPVAKITNYPLEAGEYKPYSQFAVGIDRSGLQLRALSFETAPHNDSTLLAVFCLPLGYLVVEATPSGVTVRLEQVAGTTTQKAATHYPHNGEDLQGIYWGYDLCIASDCLVGLEQAEGLSGNFFKFQQSTPQHYGAFADLPQLLQGVWWKNTSGKFPFMRF